MKLLISSSPNTKVSYARGASKTNTAQYPFEVRRSLSFLNWAWGNLVGCTKIGQNETKWKQQKLHCN